MESLFTNVTAWREFLEFIERNTNLYKLDFLGYPWYQCAIEIANNDQYSLMPQLKTPVIEKKRKSDFIQKIPLLNSKYSHVFLIRAHQRRRDVNQFENYIFHDLFLYLEKKNEPFLIFEMPSNSNEYDLKYLNSQFADVTVPYEFVLNISHYFLKKKKIIQAKKHFQSLIGEIFSAEVHQDPFHLDCVALLRDAYARLSGNIQHILILQTLLKKFGARAFWGSMMTELLTGLNNSWSVIEIEHGTGVKAASRNFSKSVARFYHDHFNWNKFFALTMSQDKTRSRAVNDNIYDYGNPELRHSDVSTATKSELVDRLRAINKKIILIATSGKTSNKEIGNLIKYINQKIPDILFLVRQHPFFDFPLSLDKIDNLRYVNQENLFVLLAVADIVISSPGSIIEQASMFTDKIIIYRNFAPTYDDRSFAHRYPWARLVNLQDVDGICKIVEDLCKTPSKVMIRLSSDVSQNIDSLFDRIDFLTESNPYTVDEACADRADNLVNHFSRLRQLTRTRCTGYILDSTKRILRAFGSE